MDCLGLDVVQLVSKESSVLKVVQLALNNVSLSSYQLKSRNTHSLIVHLRGEVRQTGHFESTDHFIWLRRARKASFVHLNRREQVIKVASLRLTDTGSISYLSPRAVISLGRRLNTDK